MQPLYMLTAVDVRRATVAGSSRATTVSKFILPPIKFVTANHNPGGGVMGVDFSLPRIEPPEPAFSIKGVDADIFDGLGQIEEWTFAAAYHDKTNNVHVPARGIIKGAIAEWTPDESDPSEFQGCNHTFREVTHYEFTLDGKELWYVDFWERVLRAGGIDRFSSVRAALGS